MAYPKRKCSYCGKKLKNDLGRRMHEARYHRNVPQPEVSSATTTEEPLTAHIIYLQGYVTALVEHYCRGHEIPADTVARGLAKALLDSTGR